MPYNQFFEYDLKSLVDEQFVLDAIKEKYNTENVDVTIAHLDNEEEYIFNLTITIPKGNKCVTQMK